MWIYGEKRPVVQAAEQLQRQFTEEYAKTSGFPSYKSIGMAYILFARKERMLFQLLYMRDRKAENRENELDSISGIPLSLGLYELVRRIPGIRYLVLGIRKQKQ